MRTWPIWSMRRITLRRFFWGTIVIPRENRNLLAGEEVVEDSDVLDDRPKLLPSRGVVLKTIEAGMTRCESGAAKQGSQCCNEPNQR